VRSLWSFIPRLGLTAWAAMSDKSGISLETCYHDLQVIGSVSSPSSSFRSEFPLIWTLYLRASHVISRHGPNSYPDLKPTVALLQQIISSSFLIRTLFFLNATIKAEESRASFSIEFQIQRLANSVHARIPYIPFISPLSVSWTFS
jgi:hypothetical protein